MVLHNPNNWHWVDKNCIYWARDYFKQQLIGLTSEDGDTEVEISDVSSVDGDCEVCQRKGKVISLFDLELTIQFKGTSGESNVQGGIKVPEVSYDNDEDDYQFTITVNDESPANEKVKPLIRNKLVPQMRQKLAQFAPDLIKEHGTGIQHTGNEPIHWESHDLTKKQQAEEVEAKAKEKVKNEPKYFGINSTSTVNTTSLTLTPKFNASPEQLCDALLEPQMVAMWTRSAPQIEPKVGGKFQLFSGNVSGEIVEVKKGELLKLKWRLKEWKPEHFATLTHKFKILDNETEMETKWEGIPVGQEEKVETNFEEYYVKPIKVTFGFGLL